MRDPETAGSQRRSRTEREITEPVDMCLANGQLNPAAVGWSRRPLHRANLQGWGRNKRFEYWCVITPELIVTANISEHDYRANVASVCIDRASHVQRGARRNRWLSSNRSLSALDGQAVMEADAAGVRVRLTRRDAGTHIETMAPGLEVDLQVFEPEHHESMGVLVPWNDKQFQYTRKNNCLQVQGRVVLDGVERKVDRTDSYAIHDYGRGRWPYNTLWNWAAGSGVSRGRQIGLQFGAKWTAGTPSTENAVRIDGRLHKISDELDWRYDVTDWMKPWTIRGDRVDLRFTPDIYHHHEFNRWLISSRGDQCFGYFDGQVVSDEGERVPVENVYGLAEEVHRKW